MSSMCPYVCDNKTVGGFCRTTFCINPTHSIVEGRITDESIKSKLIVDEYGLFRDKNFCDTCGHQYSDICGGCESLDGVPIKYSEKPRPSTLPDELTPYAVELITKCPQLINLFAEKINRMINNFEPSDPDHTEALDPIEISHVGYSMEQCGYDK